jgi:hypothetical protein
VHNGDMKLKILCPLFLSLALAGCDQGQPPPSPEEDAATTPQETSPPSLRNEWIEEMRRVYTELAATPEVQTIMAGQINPSTDRLTTENLPHDRQYIDLAFDELKKANLLPKNLTPNYEAIIETAESMDMPSFEITISVSKNMYNKLRTTSNTPEEQEKIVSALALLLYKSYEYRRVESAIFCYYRETEGALVPRHYRKMDGTLVPRDFNTLCD